jgi:hypothetical protein
MPRKIGLKAALALNELLLCAEKGGETLSDDVKRCADGARRW